MNTYWAQWSRSELNDMLDVDRTSYQDDDHDDSLSEDVEASENDVCCSGCMSCLGLSWSDFF